MSRKKKRGTQKHNFTYGKWLKKFPSKNNLKKKVHT